MRSTYLVAGALVLALVAAGVLFGTDFFKKSPFEIFSSGETQFVTQANEVASSGGVAVTFVQRDVGKWSLAGGHRLERFSLDQSGAVFGRLTSSTPLDKTTTDWGSQGLKVSLPLELNNRTNGQTVEIGFAARAPQTNGSDEVSVVYATQQAGNSGWKAFRLGPNFQLFTFTFKVPKVDAGYTSNPVVAFTADSQGSGRSVELMGVYVKPTQ